MKVLSIISLFLPYCLATPTKNDETSDLTIETSTHLTKYDATVPQFIVPGYYHPTVTEPFYQFQPEFEQNEARAVARQDLDSSELESRTILPFLINFILIPKLIMKLVKAIAFGVSAATTIGGMLLFITALVGLAIPGLRNAERSGRNLVQQICEIVPGEKVEAGKVFLALIDKY